MQVLMRYTDISVMESQTWYGCCEMPFARLTFAVHLRRKPVYYVITLLVPSLIFSVLTLISLTLQPGCEARIELGLYDRAQNIT